MMRDTKSLLLLLLSFGLIATWSYHLYDKSQYTNQKIEKIPVKDSAAIADAVRDSLQRIYTEELTQLGADKVDADSIRGQLDSRLKEIYRLKNEITFILKKGNATKKELEKAWELIRELRRRIDELKHENGSLVSERIRLTDALAGVNREMADLEQHIQQLGVENKALSNTVSQSSVFVSSGVTIAAVATRKNGTTPEVTQARKADKLILSFQVQNNILQADSAELYIIIKDPAGTVIKNDQLQSGFFITKNEGTLYYSHKLVFAYNTGEQKKITVPVELSRFPAGTYKTEVYHEGVKIAEGEKILN